MLLVIVLLMAALTVFGGDKLEKKRIPLPADAVVSGEDGPSIIVTQSRDGRQVTTEYNVRDGWEVRRAGEDRMLYRERKVNKFLDPVNLVLLAKDASFIAIMAVAMTAVIVLGGIDLSVGSIYALAAFCGAAVLRHLQANYLGIDASSSVPTSGGAPWYASVPIGLMVCCGVGALCGLANGGMIVGLKVHPFIITLGMMVVLRGTVAVTSSGLSENSVPDSFSDGFFKATLGSDSAGVNPVPVVFMAAVALLGHFVLTSTVLGRRTYAIGGNEVAAKYAGIPVGTVKIVLYTLLGAAAGLSACVNMGYNAGATPDAGQGYELNVIAAAVIGGASLSGGRGTAMGAVLGAILIQLINNAMIILDINSNYTKIVMGAAIIAAVVLDQVKTRFLSARG